MEHKDFITTKDIELEFNEGDIFELELPPPEKGEKGDNGERGFTGIKGDKGDKGESGKDGIDGIDGRDGKDGNSIKGESGKDGIDGIDGVDGSDGVAGKDGENGQDGKDGRDGKDGKAGKSGYDGASGGAGASAYQIAVALGFQGTVQQWMDSLSGGSSNLDNLTDVTILSPTNGQALVYETSTGQWRNQSVAVGGGGIPASTIVTETAYGQASAVGVGTDYARNDHTHGTPALPTKAQVGLGNVDNTSDINKPISTATQTAINSASSDNLLFNLIFAS